MKTFKTDIYGDVIITNNKIEYVEGIELIAQTVRHVLNTNLGEWFNNKNEGIDRYLLLNKNPNYDLIQDAINTAVQQTADSLGVELETENFIFDKKGRELNISFTLTVNQGDSTSISVTL